MRTFQATADAVASGLGGREHRRQQEDLKRLRKRMQKKTGGYETLEMGEKEKVDQENSLNKNKGEKEKVPLEGAAAAANRRSPSPRVLRSVFSVYDRAAREKEKYSRQSLLRLQIEQMCCVYLLCAL